MQEREKIRQLFERYRKGQCTQDERTRLHAWFNQYAGAEATGLEELQTAVNARGTVRKKGRMRWLPYAAALAAAITLAWYFWAGPQADQPVDTLTVQSGDIQPGGNRATLTLSDGSQIKLSETQSGIVVADEHILYKEGAEELVNLVAGDATQLVLSTPRGGTYQIILSDGTKVWLNAASTLVYPSHFADDERVVEIDGEGYFEVATNPNKPFKVVSREQEIEVLGTTFNISAYQDEGAVKTTLIEGNVRLRVGRSGEQLSLAPGEQSILSNATITKHTVETGPYTAWKAGDFYFDNTPLEDMMRQMSRWYDIDVIYKQTVPKESFSGAMSRNVTLQTVLELLRISEINYRLTRNKLIIE